MKLRITAICCLLISAGLNAQPGSLDYSFDDSGKVISKYFGNCYGMAIQANDKIVCVGTNNTLAYQTIRYMPDGILDTTFGNKGVVNPVVQETFNQLWD